MEQIEGSIFPKATIDRNDVQLENFLEIMTPVQKIGDMWFKRDDWFAPLGYGGVNGSKLRQLIWLINGYNIHGINPTGVISGAVSGSPQHPMAAIISSHYGLEYTSVVGTTDFEKKPTLKLAEKYGAKFLHSKVGYAKTLEHMARQVSDVNDWFLVETNIVVNSKHNSPDRVKQFHSIGAKQVDNISDNIKTLIIPCGSGTSTISIMKGIIEKKAQGWLKGLEEIILMGIGNIGSKDIDFISRRLLYMGTLMYPTDFKMKHYNLNGTGYCKYEDLMPVTYHGLEFHPRYEGKCIRYLQEKHPEHFNDTTLFWIVGSEPKF